MRCAPIRVKFKVAAFEKKASTSLRIVPRKLLRSLRSACSYSAITVTNRALYVPAAALAVGDGGVKVNGIPAVRVNSLSPMHTNDRPLQHQVELLPGVGDKPRGLIRGLQRHQQGLASPCRRSGRPGPQNGIPGCGLDHPAVAPAHNVVGVQAGGGAGENLRKVHPEFIGYLID